MWDIKDEIWDKQIGLGREIGKDFSGREIHFSEFQNNDSPYGWTLISLGDNEYLVVHLETEREFPNSIHDDGTDEFYINNKLFNVVRNVNGDWDVNSVEYNEEFIPNRVVEHKEVVVKPKQQPVYKEKSEPSYEDADAEYKYDEGYNEGYDEGYNKAYEDSYKKAYNNIKREMQLEQSQSFSIFNQSQNNTRHFSSPINNYTPTRPISLNSNSIGYSDDETIRSQKAQIDELERQLQYEQTHRLELNKARSDLRNRNSERLADEQLMQRKEIEMLENELRNQQAKAQRLEIERNRRRMEELRSEIERTQSINASTINEYYQDENTSKKLDYLNSVRSGSNSSSIINDLTRKLNEQTMQINSLKMEQEFNARKLSDIERKKYLAKEPVEKNVANDLKNSGSFVRRSIGSKRLIDNPQAQKMWDIQFGQFTNFGTDFAGRVLIKSKFGLNEEGGWDIDFYDSQSSDIYVAAIATIEERGGRQSFNANGKKYFVTRANDKWEFVDMKDKKKFDMSPLNMATIASTITPDKQMSNGNYETYSSLLVNLINFPLIHLDKFEEFLRAALSKLPFFKDIYIYSNERLYKKNESNISAYARVFFKSSSTKDDIDILLTSISLKKGMNRFIHNFAETNDLDQMTFTLVLNNHKKLLKFVHAQSNFEILRAHPVPIRIPARSLILDKEYNAILKFHENDLWKKLKPIALV